MSEQHHGDLLGGAIGETTQTAVQLATIAATGAQTMARMRARQVEADRARDQAATNAERAVLRSEHATARLTWNSAFERSFRTSASAAEAVHVWAAAQPRVDRDPAAQETARRAQERLGVLHPELIAHYQQGLADGMEPVDAMVEATAALTPSLGDLNAAAAARAIAGDERGEALQNSAVPDVAATVTVDEHSQGIHAGANHAAVSDAASARAVLLAAQAYPQPLRGSAGRNRPTSPPRRLTTRDIYRIHSRHTTRSPSGPTSSQASNPSSAGTPR